MKLFADLSEAQIAEILSRGTRRKYAKGEIVIDENDHSNALYLIKSGGVRVYLGDADGRELLLKQLGSGDYFGEVAMLNDTPRVASIMATQPTELIAFRKADFEPVMEQYPHIKQMLQSTIAKRFQHTMKTTRSLALEDVYGRLVRVLEVMATSEDEQYCVIDPKPTQQLLADYAGCSREMISRVLKPLKEGGWVRYEASRMFFKKKLPAKF